ncbi:MAG: hypothetical protein WC846_05125 [Candidatus Gracilibacteria bacterium]|jgi:hypothetical protein
MDNNQQSINVTSYFQQGGITANQVSIGIKNDRHLNDQFKVNLKPHLPKKEETIEISAIMNDYEAFQFAEEIKDFLSKEGYKTGGVYSTIYARPPVGNIIEPRKQGGIKIIIGTNKG